MDAFRTAYVYVRNIYAGVLCEKTYTSKTLFPFFDGLLPEGCLLGVVSRNWKIDVKDRFGLLLVACKDGIGNVSIREECI